MGDSKKYIYMGIIIIALGVIMTSAMEGIPRPLGLVFIGGGLVVIVLGMRKQKDEEKKSPPKE